MVHFLIKSGRVSADYVNNEQRSLVFLAVLHKRTNILNLLLTHVSGLWIDSAEQVNDTWETSIMVS